MLTSNHSSYLKWNKFSFVFFYRLRFKRRRYKLSPKPRYWKIRFKYHRKVGYHKVFILRGQVMIRFGKKRYRTVRRVKRRKRSLRRYLHRRRQMKRLRKNRRRKRRRVRRNRRRRRRRTRRRRRRRRLTKRRRSNRNVRRRKRGRGVRRVTPKRSFHVKRRGRLNRKFILQKRKGKSWRRIIQSGSKFYFDKREIRINRKGIFYKKGRVFRMYPKFRLRYGIVSICYVIGPGGMDACLSMEGVG